MKLYLSKAIEFVRARMDELSFSNDDMISPADDDRNFDTTVEKLLPEAAETVVMAAPAELLEPQTEAYCTPGSSLPSPVSGLDIEDGVMKFSVSLGSGFLRLVSFVSKDSGIYIVHPVPFDSPAARIQLNAYVRGTYDNPVLVERKAPGKIEYAYYSAKDEGGSPFILSYINTPSYASESVGKSVFCPHPLELAVLNRLTAMVLDAYNDQRSQLFYQKANSYLQ